MRFSPSSPRAWLILCAAVFALAGTTALFFHPCAQRTIDDPLAASPSPLLWPYLFHATPEQRLYRLFRDEDEAVQLAISAPPQTLARLRVALLYRGRMLEEWTGAGWMNLTPRLPGRGEFFVRVDGLNATAPPGAIRFFFRQTALAFHAGAFVFFAALGVVIWCVLAWFLAPFPLAPLGHSPPRRTTLERVAWLVAAAVILLIACDRHWRASKDFDDQYALGPAAALTQHGFDADRLFFRARVRPAFSAFSLPLQDCFPLLFVSTSKWNTDNWKRWFDKYDQPGRYFAWYLYPGYSLVALGLLIGAGFLIGRMARAFGASRLQGLIASIVALMLLWKILDNVITFSFTTALIWTAPAAALWACSAGATHRRGGAAFVFAGLAAGAAALAKETALSVALPVLVVLVLHWRARQPKAAAWREIGLYVAAALALPLIYFCFVVPGGWANWRELFQEHALQQKLYPQSFLPLTPKEALKDAWLFAGPLPLVALAGALLAMRRGRGLAPGTLFFGAWAAGACSIFLSPYVLPRFYVDFIPPLAWFTAALFEAQKITERG